MNTETVNYTIKITGWYYLLMAMLVVLKVCGVINLSWWWVFLPMWIMPAFVASLVVIIAAFAIVILMMCTVIAAFSKN